MEALASALASNLEHQIGPQALNSVHTKDADYDAVMNTAKRYHKYAVQKRLMQATTRFRELCDMLTANRNGLCWPSIDANQIQLAAMAIHMHSPAAKAIAAYERVPDGVDPQQFQSNAAALKLFIRNRISYLQAVEDARQRAENDTAFKNVVRMIERWRDFYRETTCKATLKKFRRLHLLMAMDAQFLCDAAFRRSKSAAERDALVREFDQALKAAFKQPFGNADVQQFASDKAVAQQFFSVRFVSD